MQKTEFIIDQNLKEMTKHRTDTLPVACYETTIVNNIHGHIPCTGMMNCSLLRFSRGQRCFILMTRKLV